MPSEFFTTSYLGSFTGLVAATYLLVQFFKEPIRKYLNDWWVRLLAVGIAFGIQFFLLYVNNNLMTESIGLAVLNSFLVAMTAAGMHNLSQPSSSGSSISSSSSKSLEPYPPITRPQTATFEKDTGKELSKRSTSLD